MYYAYVAPGAKGVYRNYEEVKRLKILTPYSKVRRFMSEVEAWDYIKRNAIKNPLKSIYRYGNTFRQHYVTVDYRIDDGCVYYNIKTEKLGFIDVQTTDKNISIENRSSLIKVKMSNIELNNNLISSHVIAIYSVLKILGEFVDIEFILPDHSIYYMLTAYTGNKPIILKLHNLIKNRLGEISLTVKDWRQ